MSRTSRTAGAARAAAAVCPAAPSLLLLPLLAGALLLGLWLLGAAPASAEEGPLSTGSSEAGPSGEEEPEGRLLHGGSLDLRDSAALEAIVPDEVSEPVASTLGTVHHRLERGAGRTAAGTATVLSETAGPVGEGTRRVVEELDRTRDTAQEALPPAPPPDTGAPSFRPREDDASDTGRRQAGHERSEGAAEEHGTAHGARAPLPALGASATAGPSASENASADHGSGSRAPSSPVGQPPATGSTAPGAGSAPVPGFAGYLTGAPVTVPAADTVPLAAHTPGPVPRGPSDDPTVSPD